MRTPSPDPDRLRITTQYRDRRSMVYELEFAGSQLELRISEEGDLWAVQARSGRDEGAFVVSRSAATGAQALSEVGDAWATTCASQGVGKFDWVAVEAALKAVRAL